MLRITQVDRESTVTLVFEGRLGGEWVAEAVRVWDAVLRSTRTDKIVIDLRGISYVSSAGRELLAVMHGAGARLVGSGTLLSNLIQEITQAEESTGKSQSACEGKS